MTTGPTPGDRRAVVSAIFAEAVRAHERFIMLDPAPVVAAADAMIDAIRTGRKILVFGNGGSAADAQHLAAELIGRFVRDRQALPAVALSTDSSVVTSVANDYGYDRIFSRQIDALGQRGDVAVGISTSGRSPNVLAGFAAARERHMVTVALTGRDGGPIGSAADIHVNVPEQPTARVQEVQRTVIHVICELVERSVTIDDGEVRVGGANRA